MKRFILCAFLSGSCVSFAVNRPPLMSSVHAKVFGGPPLGFTGAPGEGTCIGCHYTFGEPNVPDSGGSVQLSGLPTVFSPGQTYTLTITVAHPTARRWGFETTALNFAGTSETIGTLTIVDTVKTIKRDAGLRTYVSHYATEQSTPDEDGTAPGKAGSNSWSFNWTAPAASSGDVTFYAVGNAANNQVSPEDDYIYTTSVTARSPDSQLEADTAPRPSGSGDVVVSDWVQVGRFSVGLDTPTPGSEFQRADCAPRATQGDGQISVADWVQAGRYSVGLDPVVTAGGPATPSVANAQRGDVTLGAMALSGRPQVRSGSAVLIVVPPSRSRFASVEVWIDSQGIENAMSFSLSFDPARWAFAEAKTESGATGATLIVNDRLLHRGHVGVALALPPGRSIASGWRAVASIKLGHAGRGAASALKVDLAGNEPVRREVVDALGTVMAFDWDMQHRRVSTR